MRSINRVFLMGTCTSLEATPDSVGIRVRVEDGIVSVRLREAAGVVVGAAIAVEGHLAEDAGQMFVQCDQLYRMPFDRSAS